MRSTTNVIPYSIAVFVLLGISATKTAAQTIKDGSLQQLQYNQLLTDPPYDTGFDSKVSKKNIVWMADEIDITEPLRSFGGTIILFANKLVIDRPIDSRPYIKHTNIRPFQPSADPSLPDSQGKGVFGQLQRQPKYKKIIDDYYSHCFDCFSMSGEIYIPESPSGKTPDVWVPNSPPPGLLQIAQPGGPPPDQAIDFEVMKSGDIYIFAHEIIVNPDLTKLTAIPPERAECHSQPVNYVGPPINAGGVRGGRGGAGETSPAVDIATMAAAHPGSGMFNTDWGALTQKPGGLNGPGGRGGDGGTIHIELVNYTGDDLSGTLGPLMNVDGGLPGDAVKVITPSLAQANSPGTPDNRCAFYEQAGLFPLAAKGNPGTVFPLDNVETDEALTKLATLIRGLDARVDYDYNELAQRSKTDLNVSSLNFGDTLTKYFVRTLVSSETNLVQDVQGRFIESLPPAGTSYLSPIMAKLDLSALGNSDLSDRQFVFVRELSSFGNQADDPLINYLEKTGGLFQLYDPEPFSRYTSQATRIDIASGNVLLGQVVDKLDNIQSTLFEQLAFAQAREFRDRIQELKKQIADAQKAAQAAKNQAGSPLAFIASVITELATGEVAVDALISASQAGDPSQDDQIATNFGKTATAFSKLAALLNTPPAGGGNVAALKLELSKTMSDYDKMMQSADAIRQSLMRIEYADFIQALSLRSSFESKIESDSAQFHDLFRAVMITYFEDRAKSQFTLSNNLMGLVSFLNRFPIEEPYLRLAVVDRSCEQFLHPCFSTTTSAKWRFVNGNVKVGEATLKLPLYVLSPSAIPASLPTYGLSVSSTLRRDPPYPMVSRRVVTQPAYSPYGWIVVPH